MTTLHTCLRSATALCAAALLAACGSGGGGGGGTGPTTASFSATDAPVDNVSTVQITFNRIDLKPKNGEVVSIDLDPAITIANLLDLTGETSQEIVSGAAVEPGEYNWVRVFVTGGIPDSKVVEDAGGEFDLFIPGQQKGNPNASRWLHLNSGFIIPAGGNTDFTIDFVLQKGLTKPSGADYYLLRPALRLIDNVEVGTITGTVDASLIEDASCLNDVAEDEGNAVYLYAGDVIPNDTSVPAPQGDEDNGIESEPATQPLTVANVKQNLNTAEYEYTIGFVAAGDYTIAFTCQSLADDPDNDDDIAFVQPTAISVVADQVTTQNFVAEQADPPAT